MNHKLLSGTLEMMIMEVLSHGPSYGYEITQTVLNRSAEFFELKEGSLYPALHRLERAGQLESFWEQADGRRRKYYRLTVAGKQVLEVKRSEWTDFASAVNGVLGLKSGLLSGEA